MGRFKNAWNALRLKEQVGPEFSGATGFSIDPDEGDYRRLSQGQRDLLPLTFERSLQISLWLYEKDPLAKRIIDIPVQAMKSAGLQIEAEDPKVQELLDDFWGAPIRGFRAEFWDLFRDIKLMGEAHWPIGVNPMNGDIELGFIDPQNVDGVMMERGNAKKADKVKIRVPAGSDVKALWDVIRYRRGMLDGELFHFAINKPVNSTRGRPALIALADWIDVYDQALFNEAERWSLLRNFLWDVKINGATEQDIDAWMKKHFADGIGPKPGAVRVHNENEEWKPETPDLKAADASEMSKTLRNHVVGGAGMPDFFFGWGGDVNVATAREMAAPTMWMIEDDQEQVKQVLNTVFAFVIQKAKEFGRQVESGTINEATDHKFSVSCNDVFPRDMVQEAAVLSQTVNALAVAKTNDMIGAEVARKVFVTVLNKTGYEVAQDDVDAEFEEFGQLDMFPVPANGNGNGKPAGGFDGMTQAELLRMSKGVYSERALVQLRDRIGTN